MSGTRVPAHLLRLQRLAGNKAARLAVQRHKLDQSRQGVGAEDDAIEDTSIQRYAPGLAGESHRSTSTAFDGPRAHGFGRAPVRSSAPLWGDGGVPSVQRRKGGKGGKKVAGASPKVLKKATEEFKSFVGGGPYKINDFVPDFTENFGKFDTVFNPSSKLLTINMRVKFTFPDLPMPKGKDLSSMIEGVRVQAVRAGWVTSFLTQVQKGWTGKFDFKNVRQPAEVWGKLNPISVKLNVTNDEASPHYVMEAYVKKSATANVSPNPAAGGPGRVQLFKGDLDSKTQGFTGSAQTGPDEVARLQRNLPKIRFMHNSSAVESPYIPDLRYVSDYLKRMNLPKFNIDLVGHASKGGKDASNLAISVKRAESVRNMMKSFGVTNHTLTSKGVGTAGATGEGKWRKVEFGITVDKSFSNVQDTTMHEFGHMLGLDDEYQAGRAIQLQHQRKLLQKMLGTESYGKGKRNRYADEVTSVDALQSASVMYSGQEVRAYHYVTMWQALFNTAAKAPTQPVPAFTFKDWKVIG